MDGATENWRDAGDTPDAWKALHNLISTQVLLGPIPRIRVVLHTAAGPVELFRAPTNATWVRDRGAPHGARALVPERWFQGMENAVAARHAIRALEEPL